MAFPSQHVYPSGLPVWLLRGPGGASHDLVAGERVATTQFEQGEDRQREIRRFTSWTATASALFTQAQFDRFVQWHTTDLQNGSQLFDTRVQSLHGGRELQWWQSKFIGPFRWTAHHGHFIVVADIILLDGPYDSAHLPSGASPGDPPRTAPSLLSLSAVGGLGSSSIGRGVLTQADMAGRGIGEGDGWLIIPGGNSLGARGVGEGDGQGELSGTFLFMEDGEIMEFEDGEVMEEET